MKYGDKKGNFLQLNYCNYLYVAYCLYDEWCVG